MRFRHLSLAAFLPTLVFMMLINAGSVRSQGKGQDIEQITKFDVPDSLTHGVPIRMQDNIFLNNSHCPSAKLDIWFSQGSVSSMLFVPGSKDDPIQRALQSSKNHINTYLIGPKECMFKVTVEPVRNIEDGK